MTITVSPGFDELSITFDDYIDMSQVFGGDAYFLVGCGEDQARVNLSVDNMLLTLDGQTVTIPIDTVFAPDQRTTWQDGVYIFNIELWDNIGSGTTHTIQYCMFIGTVTNCKVAKLFLCQEDEIIEYLYKALLYINKCDDCDCSKMCDIYAALQNRITTLATKTNTNVYNDCGCQ